MRAAGAGADVGGSGVGGAGGGCGWLLPPAVAAAADPPRPAGVAVADTVGARVASRRRLQTGALTVPAADRLLTNGPAEGSSTGPAADAAAGAFVGDAEGARAVSRRRLRAGALTVPAADRFCGIGSAEGSTAGVAAVRRRG